MDDGVIQDDQYNMNGTTFEPNYDMFLWGWGGDPDPNFIMSIFTTAQINSWSDSAWSNAPYDKLFLEQQTTIDPTKRAAIVHQMEQIIYDAAPYVVLAYQQDLQAYQSGAWQGWVRYPRNCRTAVFSNDNIDSYRFAEPKPAAAASGSSAGLVVGADSPRRSSFAGRRVVCAPAAYRAGRRALKRDPRPARGVVSSRETTPPRRGPVPSCPRAVSPSSPERTWSWR